MSLLNKLKKHLSLTCLLGILFSGCMQANAWVVVDRNPDGTYTCVDSGPVGSNFIAKLRSGYYHKIKESVRFTGTENSVNKVQGILLFNTPDDISLDSELINFILQKENCSIKFNNNLCLSKAIEVVDTDGFYNVLAMIFKCVFLGK